MDLDQLNRDIDSVIDRLRELETKDYRDQFGVESQERSRRFATQMLKELLLRKENYSNLNITTNIFNESIQIKKRKNN